MKIRIIILIILTFLISCNEPIARKPKKHSTKNFYNEVIAQNKKLNNLEKKKLELWIAKDTLHQYKESNNGYWYYYEKKDTLQNNTPKLNDLVELEFDIKKINGTIIYNKQKRIYKIDKEDFIPALQNGVKLMKKGETITFLIPSYRAFGVSGDGYKIGFNQPLLSTLTLINIKQINNDENH